MDENHHQDEDASVAGFLIVIKCQFHDDPPKFHSYGQTYAPDILIDIQMNSYGTFDFDKSEKIIAIG